MGVKVTGVDEIHEALVEVVRRLHDKTLITSRLETGMRRHVHVITGYLKSTIYHDRMVAGADADYAGDEADKGGSHDYGQRAINAFPVEEYFDEIVEAF